MKHNFKKDSTFIIKENGKVEWHTKEHKTHGTLPNVRVAEKMAKKHENKTGQKSKFYTQKKTERTETKKELLGIVDENADIIEIKKVGAVGYEAKLYYKK